LALRRVWSGPFRVEEGISPQALLDLEMDARAAWLRPLEQGLHDLPQVTLTDEGAVRLRNGNPGSVLIAPARPGDTVWGSYKGQPVAVGTYLGGMLHPSRVFNL
jgi:tRNA pseudouridine55 synthase